MKTLLTAASFGLAILIGCPSISTAQLKWRVSVKIITDAQGNLPSTGNFRTPDKVIARFGDYNRILDSSGRGYTFELTEAIALTGVSQWFDVDIHEKKAALESAAKNNPTLYAWRKNTINIYVNGGPGGGKCSRPRFFLTPDLIFIGRGAPSITIFHEIGHYFGLCHTHGCINKNCDGRPGDEGIADTLPDDDCWGQDEIALNAFGKLYNNLSPHEQKLVDDTYLNIMSYHSNRDRLTSDQLDWITKYSNGRRNRVASGRTRFVGGNGGYTSIKYAIDVADEGDIVLIRTGAYNEKLTINKRVTLRASRGNAVIWN